MFSGLIDLHIHTAPDLRPRRLTDVEQARLARDLGAAGIVLKSHIESTVARARAAAAAVPGLHVYGGLALNRAAGGLDPLAVRTAAAEGSRLVWLPTLDAANHRRLLGRGDGIEVVDAGRPVPALREILRIIADHDIALATGHIAPDESRIVLAAASDAGVRRLIVTHPEHAVVAMSLDLQAELARSAPVYFERCYAQPAGASRYVRNTEANLAAVRHLGPQTTLLATDCGQLENTPWDEAWRETFAHMAAAGFGGEALAHMTQAVPAYLLGLQPTPPVLAVAAGSARPT
jgi:hypothetical protein